ncbi:acyl-CoA dehydrogenase [Mycobacterium sp. CVI_P3]|uniref:Acyl-CoA dehydrogenase n=1 Tax=Mycobacterium pinniadriaticum TaxID=2994102 RepID=A0ABT3SJG9_9MYCO|nr:acyl-CoA dehydrogenase [Mycobacterium pinniadriaticum]MCX2932875.1 acyl-CoA dehydrogenase [Mycobacterium pinniadriaticum]MCX2939298.1 acyl-CoA dehydrogenase [Mycobacterium pinniadriaticum]
MTPGLVRRWLDAGELDLPLPGSGRTLLRWRKLAAFCEADVVAGRLAEAHTDAVAILAELKGPPVRAGRLWGVWAAETPHATVQAHRAGDRVTLSGTKAWCSGAGICSDALVTATTTTAGDRGLYAVDLTASGVQPLPSSWRNTGMAASDTRSVQFTAAPAIPVGDPGDYLRRPGFWHGAAGVSACWLGAARAVAAPLYRAVAEKKASGCEDPHAAAHLGAVDAALAAAQALLASTAEQIDAEPISDQGETAARRLRAVVEWAVDEVIGRSGRALGPAPLALDAAHARRVADLSMYVRQSHAERDLATLGNLVGR